MAFYPSPTLEGIMLTLLTLTFHFQIEVLFGIKKQTTLHNFIHIHTTQNAKGTGTYIYSILTHPALRCNLDMLMEEDIYTVQLHFITTNVVINCKYADIYNVNT